MRVLEDVEKKGVEVFKQAPHLPKNVREWIVTNAWWIVLVGVVLSVLSIIGSLQALLWANQLASQFYGVRVVQSPLYDLSLWVSIASFAVIVVLEAKAINPLKAKRKSGWDLIFLATLIGLASNLVSSIIAGSYIGAIFGLVIGGAIAGYFLFETRDGFSTKAAKK